MARMAAGNNQAATRRMLTPTYPSFSFIMHRFWYFVQLPVQVQPAPSATRRSISPPVYDTNPRRINLATERDDGWAMRTRDGSEGIGASGSFAENATHQPNTPQLVASPDNAASKISLLSLGSTST